MKRSGKRSGSTTRLLSETSPDKWLYGIRGDSKYDPNYPKAFYEFAVTNPHSSITAFAVHLGVPRETLMEWVRKHKHMGRARAMAQDIFEAYWEDFGHDGMQGKFSAFHQAAYIHRMRARFSWSDQGPMDQEDDDLEFEYD